MLNHLYILYQLYPDKKWDWYEISSNPNITWDIVCTSFNKIWNWSAISRNPNITWDIIHANPDKPWDWNILSINKYNSNIVVKSKSLSKKYYHIWRHKVRARNLMRAPYKVQYEAVLDMLKLRALDCARGVRARML